MMVTAAEDGSFGPIWPRRLRRIGVVVIGLVFAGLLIVGALAGWFWLEERSWSARLNDRSRTYEGPLLPDGDPHVRGRLIELLRQLPTLESMNGNGLRFVAAPTFGTTEYAVAVFLPEGAEEATGVLVTVPKMDEGRANERSFTFPPHDYAALVNEVRVLTEDWGGEKVACLDGTPVAFELAQEGQITSGAGNCSDHYRHLGLLLLDAVRRFAPGDDLPTEYDWHRFEPDDPEI